MIDKNTGKIQIADSLIVFPNYTFDEYKNSKFYNGETGVQEIQLEDPQMIDGKNYLVSLIFINNVIYSISLVNVDEIFSEQNEPERKKVHDEILKECGINSDVQYGWGRVSSDYDSRGNVSSISIYYKE